MADSFFGFDTSYSNLNDDEGGGEPSEDEYDALNDETFGQDSDGFDWEVEHEQQSERVESNRKRLALDHSASQIEASLSQLVLDETDAPHRTLGSSVWRHDAPFPASHTPVPGLKNVCTVEELERQLRQKQAPQQGFNNSNFFQPRFPVILQRPPGLQAPVPLPFAPQQPLSHNMNQSFNNILNPNSQLNQMGQSNLMQNQMGPNLNQMSHNLNQMVQGGPMGQNVGQIGQNVNQMGQNVNQFMQNANQMANQFQNNQIGQNNLLGLSQGVMNQMGQPNQLLQNQMGKNVNQMPQNMNQINQSVNQMGQSLSQMGQNVNHMGQNVNPIGQNVNQMGQNVNPIGQNVNQMIPNGNQFNTGMNQFPHMMGQPRMMAPPPGMGMPRQMFSPNMGQFNQNFRGPTIQSKPNEPQLGNQPNAVINPMQQQMKNQSTQVNSQKQPSQMNQPINNMNQPINMNQQINNMNQPINNMNQSINNMNQSINNMNQSINNMNQTSQSPQQKANQGQKQIQNQKFPEQKLQKSRIYNNSKNPQLTSQNLVQMIQNTHPMLQFNNSFHNATHHPMFNNRNNMFNNNQFLNNHMFNNQRHNGTYSNNNRHMNGDDLSSGSDCDEYAGLMTPREKQWLVNIQMLQLNTGTPYIHDFYYTVFLERQANKEKEGVKEAHKANQQNHPFYSGAVKQESHGRERHNSNRHNSTSEDGAAPRTYVPTQFENSLGKLQCGSVTAPRKIIDLEVVGSEPARDRDRAPSRASTAHPAEVPREMRRTKQLLLDIEALYLILLRLEELNDPLAISNALILKEREEKQKQLEQAQREAENDHEEDSNLFLRNIESVQRRPKQDSPKSEGVDKRQVVNLAVSQKPVPVKNLLDEDKDELVSKMFAGLLHGDRVQQMLTVRKGRLLLCRFASRWCVCGAGRGVWSRVLRAVSAAARRDDGTLPLLAPHYHKYIQNTSGWSAVLESCSLLAEALDPARTPYALTTSFTLSAVCSLIEKVSTLINTPEATSNERQWFKFLKTLARALKNTTVPVAKPLKPLQENKLICHIKQLESRSTIEILQRGKSAEFADLTKTDVSEQLIRHLC